MLYFQVYLVYPTKTEEIISMSMEMKPESGRCARSARCKSGFFMAILRVCDFFWGDGEFP